MHAGCSKGGRVMREEDRDGRWMPVGVAAELLGYDPVSLRRSIARHAEIADDGTAEAKFDGITARKVGNTWRVWLAPAWRRPS